MQLINLNKNISIIYYNNFLIIKSYYTHVVLDILKLRKFKSSIVLNSSSLRLVTKSIGNKILFNNQLISLIKGVNNFYYKKLNLIGIGFRAWVTKNKLSNKKLVIKFGFSKYIILTIPKEVVIFCLRSTLMVVKGPDKEITNFIAARIRFLKRINIYKGKGILYENEVIQLKLGKQK